MHATSPSVFRTVSIGISNLDLLVETDRAEGGVNNFTSVPRTAIVYSSIVYCFIHLVKVSFHAGMYDFDDLIQM